MIGVVDSVRESAVAKEKKKTSEKDERDLGSSLLMGNILEIMSTDSSDFDEDANSPNHTRLSTSLLSNAQEHVIILADSRISIPSVSVWHKTGPTSMQPSSQRLKTPRCTNIPQS